MHGYAAGTRGRETFARRVLVTAYTCAILGLEGRLVEVQVDITRQGLPTFIMVGLLDDAIREAKERVSTAIKNAGLTFPNGRRFVCCR